MRSPNFATMWKMPQPTAPKPLSSDVLSKPADDALPLNQISLPIKAGDHRRWAGVSAGAAALVVAEAARRHRGLTLVVTADTGEALRLEQELHFYLDGTDDQSLELLPLPDWETLPYDVFSPHEDIVSQRIRTLQICRERL